MPPKGYTSQIFNPPGVYWQPKPVKIIARMGTRVYIDYPKEVTYDIKSADVILSVGIAINNARHTYCEYDWSKVYYTVGQFMYQEILTEK